MLSHIKMSWAAAYADVVPLVVLFFVAVSLFITGAGKYSVDSKIGM